MLTKIYAAVGPVLWEDFIKCFSDIYLNHEHLQGDFIITGGVAGLYTIYEAMLLIGNEKSVHGAFLDVDTIYYFSLIFTAPIDIPDNISSWMNKFMEKTFIILTPEYVRSLNVEKPNDF